MKTELGNLMAENPDTSALELLCFRLNAMRKDMDDATEALMAIEQIYTDGSDAYEDKNAMGAIARNFLHYRSKHSG